MRCSLIAICLLVLGCSDDDVNVGGLTCGTAPCGGDPVGAWTIGATCVSGELTNENCPEADVRFAFDQSGTVTVNADNTYEAEITTSGFVRATIPASCFQGLLTDCGEIGDEDTTCTGDASVECECEQTIDEQASSSGTWSTSGDQLTIDGDPADYCVDGDAMSIRPMTDGAFELELLMTR